MASYLREFGHLPPVEMRGYKAAGDPAEVITVKQDSSLA